MANRICRYCNIERDFSEFVRSRSGLFGISWCCRVCLKNPNKLKYQKKIPPPKVYKPKVKSRWLSITTIGINGYKGAAIYKLSFDNGELFYIGSTTNTKAKPQKWQRAFRNKKLNRKMKSMIQDKSCATLEIVEKITDVSKLLEREEYHIQSNFDSPFILNVSRYASGALDECELREKMKPVKQCLGDVVIATHESLIAASKNTGIHLSKIWSACNGQRKSKVSGFTFAYINQKDIEIAAKNFKIIIPKIKPEEESNIIALYSFVGLKPLARQHGVGIKTIKNILVKNGVLNPSISHSKPILQFDKAGNLIRAYSSIGEAARDFGNEKARSRISDVLNGRAMSWKKFVFKFA